MFMTLGAFVAFAQLAVGDFRSHISMHGFTSVAVDDNTLYAASANGVMLLDKASTQSGEPDISVWSKVEGLSDIDIVKIFHEDEYKIYIFLLCLYLSKIHLLNLI